MRVSEALHQHGGAVQAGEVIEQAVHLSLVLGIHARVAGAG
jgi:hypothetical protein